MMMRNSYGIIFLFSCIVLSFNTITAQTTDCGISFFENELSNTDPAYVSRQQQIESGIADTIQKYMLDSLKAKGAIAWGVIKIPVVFHLIGDAVTSNPAISLFSIQQRLISLNEDYRKVTGSPGDGNGVDTQVEFCLAQRDENGNASTGVIYKYGGYGPYCKGDDAAIKNISNWNPAKYLNIWICDLSNCTEKGWGSMPAMYFTNSNTALKYRDGVVCDMNTFTSRLLTHEIGHWLNLIHTYGADNSACGTAANDDGCQDTPWCTGSNKSVAITCQPKPSQCIAQNSSNYVRQIENYMDDSDGGCMNMFTTDQTTRIHITLSNIRPGIIQNSTAGCNSPGPPAPTCNDGIKNGNESGIDCGGSCLPCGNCAGFSINQQGANWYSTTNVCNNVPILLKPCGNYQWPYTQVIKDNLNHTDGLAEWCVQDNTLISKYSCSYKMLYFSIQEYNSSKSPIGPEYGNWFNISHSPLVFDLYTFLILLGKQNLLTAGKYYRIKFAYNENISHYWNEMSGFIKVFESNVSLLNQNVSNSQVGDNISIYNSSIGSPINVVATNQIEVLPNSSFTSGNYFIAPIDCNNMSGFRRHDENVSNNVEDEIIYDNVELSNSVKNSPDNTSNQSSSNDKVTIVPNPNTGSFAINISQGGGILKSIEIQNLFGNVILKFFGPFDPQTEVNIQDQPSGLYLVKISYDDKVIVKKIIKQ